MSFPRRLLAGTSAGAFIASTLLVMPVATAADPIPNPPMSDSCGVDVNVILDASGSVESANAVDDVRDAAEAFLEALTDTNSTARVIQFGTVAEELAPQSQVDSAAMAPGGVLRDAVVGYYNPRPPRPNGVNLYAYDGSGSLTSSNNWNQRNNNNQYTNWDQAFEVAAPAQAQPVELTLMITDGDPTAYDFDQAGDPFDAGPPPDVGFGTQNAVVTEALDRAVEGANAVKSGGSRILAIGVGAAVTGSQASVDRLKDISGPNVADDIDDFDILTTDVALVEDFGALAEAMRGVVVELCSPSLTVRKLAQSPDSALFTPANGWDITVSPSVAGAAPGDDLTWILPDTTPAASKTQATNNNGFAQFQWEPEPATASSTATVTEQMQPGYLPGRTGEDDWTCESKNPDGTSDLFQGELVSLGGGEYAIDPDVPVGPEQIVTCTLYNEFDYQPDISLTKVNAPTEVRGDLNPEAEVVSTYEVTNPGNTPLTNVTVTDDRCSPVDPVVDGNGFNVGDVDGDDHLAPADAETWVFECTRAISRGLTDQPINIVNIARAAGQDPTGTEVTDLANDDVDVFVPGIEVTKLANGETLLSIVAGDDVTYTYEVRNLGNTPLSPVTLVDDTPPCTDPSFTGGDTNGDNALDLAEVWTYECVSPNVQDPVSNTATVTGTPTDPATAPGPDVTDADTAGVVVLNPGVALTKSVDQDVVFAGTPVTYTYEAENTGDTDLANETGNPGWVVDDRCSPVTQVVTGGFNVGDVNTDDLMNPDEIWEFECTSVIDDPTNNIGTIVAQPVENGNPAGPPLIAVDFAHVDVVEADIHIEKTALQPVVLDPAAAPVSGPDTPSPRPAVYTYEVTNPGDVPLSDVGANIIDDKCSPLVYRDGDLQPDGLLDPGEVWTYDCQTTLSKADGQPPDQDVSALVTNTVDVSGVPVLAGQPYPTETVSDQTTAEVEVIEPGISITKSVDSTLVRPGTTVTYTYEVANTGDVSLDPVVADDRCRPLEYESGDDNGDGILDGANSGSAETWTYTCSAELNFPSPVVNTAAVQATDPLGNIYQDEDTAQVEIFDPDINLEKSVSDDFVPAGSQVTYTFEVTNTGTSPVPANDVLADIRLNDVSVPANPSCDQPAYVSGDTNNDQLLELPETWIYECTGVVDVTTVDGATVLGTALDGLPVGDTDSAIVTPYDAGLDVTKTADPVVMLEPGGPVTYTYEVVNTGNVPLAEVASRITDDTCSPVTYVSGDDDDNLLLTGNNDLFETGLPETWIFECTTDVTATTQNTVTVPGTPVRVVDNTPEVLGPDVEGSDTAVVEVIPYGSAEIEKVVEGDGAAYATHPFTFSVQCHYEPLDLDVFDGTVTITPPDTSVLIPNLPVGTECTIEELPPYGGAVGPASVSPNPVTVPDSDTPVTVTATNTFSTGDLDIHKVVTGDAADEATDPFIFDIACTFVGEDLDPQPGAVTITPPLMSATVAGLPTGAECTIEERAPYGGADGPATIDPGSVVIGDGEAVTVTATNTFTPEPVPPDPTVPPDPDEPQDPAEGPDDPLAQTGSSIMGTALTLGGLLLALGLGIWLVVRPRTVE